MLNFQYIGDTNNYSVSFSNINKNVVEVIGDFPKKETGFILTRMGNPSAFKGDYSDFKTVYKEIKGGIQFSNNGSVYIPKVVFNTSDGGALAGETLQEAKDYSELVIPTPIADNDFEFAYWNPEIPLSGDIDGNKSFTAIFTSTLPEQEVTPIEDRVSALESALINNI